MYICNRKQKNNMRKNIRLTEVNVTHAKHVYPDGK